MSRHSTLDWLEQHPRMIGFLFTVSMVLMQAGNVVANQEGVTNGP
ncbi:DUF7503 family protein [Halorussus litoreus]